MKRLLAYIDPKGLTGDELANLGKEYENYGIDGLVVFNFTEDESEHESFLESMRALTRKVDIPVMTGCKVKRFEDTKKAYYTGAKYVVLRYSDIKGTTLLKESVDRFGAEHILVGVDMANGEASAIKDEIIAGAIPEEMSLAYIYDSTSVDDVKPVENSKGESLVCVNSKSVIIKDVMKKSWVEIAATDEFKGQADTIMQVKNELKSAGIAVNVFDPHITFAELKKNSDGMVPCIVQDYKDNTVLMLAYMNEEAFNKTIETGVMTYYSRSRDELWVKGLTSGHYQYLKELSIDCDSDTLLAKVDQVGAACHTGNRSCFYTQLVKHDYDLNNAHEVLNNLYGVIMDRKKHPKEGSYTNYLFDKGIDKILKKCGEEATEMVIAAKNPNAEELKYEIADLMYHMTVLMAVCGVDWDDVMGELANR